MTKTTKRRTILLYVPTGIDIKQLLRDNGSTQAQINVHLDKYHYLLHTIYVGSLHQYDIKESNGYTRIKDDHLKPFLQGYRNKVKKNLLAWGVIETDNHHIIGRKSKGWRIAPQHAQSFRAEICINESFEDKLRNKKAYVNTLKGPAQYLYDMIQRIGIRSEEANTCVSGKYSESLRLLRSIPADHYTAYNEEAEKRGLYVFKDTFREAGVEALERNITDKYNADLIAINSIENGIFKLSLDKYGRLHTPLTNSSRFLRRFLFDKRNPDVPLYSLDLSCSQPFFLSILLMAAYRHDMPESVRRYIEDTSTGVLYERMMEELAIPEHRRRWFKTEFFGSVFFCSLYTMNLEGNLIAQGFRRLYPEVFGFIQREKRNVYEDKRLVRDFRYFPRQMQRVESDAIINKVVMQAQRQGIWLTTIHDACLVLEDDVQAIYDIIEAVFREEYSLAPTIKVEALRGAERAAVTLPVEEVEPEAALSVAGNQMTDTGEVPAAGNTASGVDSDLWTDADEFIKSLPADKWNGYFSRVYLDTSMGNSFFNSTWEAQEELVQEDKVKFESDDAYRGNWMAVIREWKGKKYGLGQVA